jgi:hypothetical protein
MSNVHKLLFKFLSGEKRFPTPAGRESSGKYPGYTILLRSN